MFIGVKQFLSLGKYHICKVKMYSVYKYPVFSDPHIFEKHKPLTNLRVTVYYEPKLSGLYLDHVMIYKYYQMPFHFIFSVNK